MTFVEFRVFTCPSRRRALFILRLYKIEVVMPFTESIASILRELVTRIRSTGCFVGGGEVGGGGFYVKVQQVVQSCVNAPTTAIAAAGAIWS